MPRIFRPHLNGLSSSRTSYLVVGILLTIGWMAFGFAPFSLRAVRSESPSSETATATTARSLSLEERVKYERAVEEVYWRHTTWPEQSASPKPSFDSVTPLEKTRAKVEDTLRKSEALAQLWKRPVTAEQLQAEMQRMARDSRQPEVLREILNALNNDPFLIAEVLARPVLVERLTRNAYASDERFHGALRVRAEDAVRAHDTVEKMREMGGRFSEVEAIKVAQKQSRAANSEDKTIAAENLFTNADTTLKLTPAEWEAETARLATMFKTPDDEQFTAHANSAKMLMKNRVSSLQEDANSFYVTAVIEKTESRLKVARVEWQKKSFDSWWGEAQSGYEAKAAPTGNFNYKNAEINQAAAGADDTWTPMSALPTATSQLWPATAVWTGTEMIIWGGQTDLGGRTNSGSRYNPATDTWTPTSTINAPRARRSHSAVWTGTEMIVWGGCNPLSSFCGVADGGRYNPQTDTWTPISSTNAPTARGGHSVIWTGSKMIIWGGCSFGNHNSCSTALNTGGIYDPATDTWTATSTVNAPSGRSSHRAVWTGTEMIIWGSSNTGGRYNPATNTWTPTETFNAPSARGGFTMVWTGAEVVVWGGYEGNFVTLNTGGRYNPATNSWTPTSTAGAPAPRYNHSAVWTGSEMIVFGGDLRSVSNNQEATNTGARYNPSTDSWTPTSTLNAPTKLEHHAVWTGSELIVWSGSNNKTGGRYNPATNSWTPTNNNDSVAAPLELGVWSGTEFIVWGPSPGCSGCGSSGGRYNPATHSWTTMNTTNAPNAITGGTAFWTGSEMIVWTSDGGRYNPQTDSWTRIQTTGAPVGGKAVWTGSEMIVWGGQGSGRYNLSSNSWTPISTAGEPSARNYYTAVWSGTEMIIWGGSEFGTGVHFNNGGRYNPSTDSWTQTSTVNAPSVRRFHTAVWTGNEMVVWGGMTGDYNNGNGFLNTGGRYNPATDSWQPTSLVGAPSPRIDHTAVWTGAHMLIWGGNSNTGLYMPAVHTGARYNPLADAWTPTSTQSAPSARTKHVAVWTGTGMIVWGGIVEDGTATHGAIYNSTGSSNGNIPPFVSINVPIDGATFESGANININVNATDSDGTISTVHFYANNTLIGTDATSPFNFAWNEVRGGSYSLTAVATDNSGGVTTSSPVRINVNVSTAPPVCLLASPANGATYAAPADVSILANAQANRDRTLSKVEFFNGTDAIGTYTNGPYGYTWSNLGAGTYNFSVRCTDSAGAVVTSPTSVVTINPDPNSYLRVTGLIADSRGVAIPNLRVRLDSSQSSTPVYATTNLNGYYQFYSLASGANHTLTPESAVYSFSPASRSYTAMTQNDDNANFVATQIGYGISGHLTDSSGKPLYPATVNLSGSATASKGTDATGYYFFSNLAPGGNYTVQPYKNQYEFVPSYRTFNNLSAEQVADFTANSLAQPSRIQLSQANYVAGEASGNIAITVNRSDATSAANVDYTTSDTAGLTTCNTSNGVASSRCDYATSIGTLRFAAGEASKTIYIPVVDDAYTEGVENLTVKLSNPSGADLGAATTATVTITDNETATAVSNPIDQTAFFVREHYIDFLGREPDPAGLAGWQNVLNNCGITIAEPCDRIEVSAGFFRSPEFQDRGYLIYRFYSAVGKIPLYENFMPDFAKVSGFLSAQQLEENKVAFVNEFMTRSDFQTKYGALTDPTAYVNALLQTVGLPNHPSRQAWITGLTNGSMTRATVLRSLVESTEVYQKYYNEAFVIMQYFGYLRRSADISYLNWVETMNNTGGDYRIMINGFLNSAEYRNRFAP
jgi:N-acetylneuraminic acid mutarotase